VTGAAACVLGYLGYSVMQWNRPVPSDEAVEEYAEYLATEIMGMKELVGSWREEVLPVGGQELHLYHFESKPDDPVMVFVPGTSVYALLYAEYLYKFSRQGFNVVGFDPRGHGKSSGKRGVYTLGGLVEDTLAVIDHCVRTYNDTVAVSGSSQGGMVAFYCAAAEPRLKAAVCHNVISPDEPDNERMTRWPFLFRPMMPFLDTLRPLAESPLGELMTPIALYLDLKAEKSRLVPDVSRFLRDDPLALSAVSFSALHSLASTPIARKVEDIQTPVMVIHSGGDNIFPEDCIRRVYGRLRCDKEFVYIPDAPHLVMLDHVDELVPRISAWVKERVRD
jgi:pimeloyl-ACP methyl ester carboxylesterase